VADPSDPPEAKREPIPFEQRAFCPQCGLGVGFDEDGCCTSCGATVCSGADLRSLLTASGWLLVPECPEHGLTCMDAHCSIREARHGQ